MPISMLVTEATHVDLSKNRPYIVVAMATNTDIIYSSIIFSDSKEGAAKIVVYALAESGVNVNVISSYPMLLDQAKAVTTWYNFNH